MVITSCYKLPVQLKINMFEWKTEVSLRIVKEQMTTLLDQSTSDFRFYGKNYILDYFRNYAF